MNLSHLFRLTSSEWQEDEDRWLPDETMTSWDHDPGNDVVVVRLLQAALESLASSDSSAMHPRASLEDVTAGMTITIYRSGRLEWNSHCEYPGYDMDAQHINASRETALELWKQLLRGQLDSLQKLPWKTSADTHCHVCGYSLSFAPWGPSGNQPTFAICDCCGCEFGVDDRSAEQVSAYRDFWKQRGYPWFKAALRPMAWQPMEQLHQVPTDHWRSWLPVAVGAD